MSDSGSTSPAEALSLAGLGSFRFEEVGRELHHDALSRRLFAAAGPSERLEELLERLWQEDRPLLEKALDVDSQTGRTARLEARTLDSHGGRRLRIRLRGRSGGYLGVVEELGRAASADLPSELQEIYRTLFERAPIAMGVADLHGRLLFFNDALIDMGGYGRRDIELLDTVAGLYWDPADRVRVFERLRREGSIDRMELKFRRRDGTPFAGALSLVPFEHRGRHFNLASVEDLSERRALEEQLFRSQKLEAVGRLAGGIAHDFNNLMTVILGHASFLETAADDQELLGSVDQIARAGEKAAELTRKLLTFARRQMIQPRVVDLNALVHELDSMMRRLLGEDIELVTRTPSSLWPVKVDPGQLEQVLVNLAINARDAMPRGGALTISSENVEVGAEQPYNPKMPPGPYVRLEVADTGEGMDEEMQERVFEPFFTTKIEGSGLGLATCYGIVKQAGGFIWVQSKAGEGTEFEIYLPRAEGEPGGLERPEPPVGEVRGSESILLIEDDPQLNSLVSRALQSLGYVVHSALNGESALELSDDLERVDLLITDVVLPKLGGPEVARELRDERPALPILFMSGYTDDRALLSAYGSDADFIAKPFTPGQLADKVRRMLDRNRPAAGPAS